MLQEYGIWQLKKNYGKEYMGIVRTTLIIDPQGVIKAIWKNVKVKEHAKEVMKKLQELQA
jgi:peroxiredoxin Q/BCP